MSRHFNRRVFLKDGFLVVAGAAGGAVLPSVVQNVLSDSTADAKAAQPEKISAEKRLRQLGIQLPPSPKPVAVYVPAVQTGDTLFTSGHGPRKDGKLIQGKVGKDLTLKQGYDAARVTGLNVLSTVRTAIGSLDRVVRLVKVLGMVNCTPDFKQQPQVINGFSELMVQVFGEKNGKGARSAVGMAALPSNIPVEIEAIFEIRRRML